MTDLARTILLVIAHTPIWVWILYAALIGLGLQRTRDSSVPLWRMLILPLVVALLSISSAIGGGLEALFMTLFGLAAGGAVGWRLERPDASRRMPGGRLWLRGEWLSLVQIVLVLAVRYASNAVGAMNPMLSANPLWHFGTLLVCSLLSGVFLGRTGRRLRIWSDTPPSPAPRGTLQSPRHGGWPSIAGWPGLSPGHDGGEGSTGHSVVLPRQWLDSPPWISSFSRPARRSRVHF